MTKMHTTAIRVLGGHSNVFTNITCTGFDVAMDISNSNNVEVSSLNAHECKKVLKLRKVCDSKFEKINVKLNSDNHQKKMYQFRLTELNLAVRYWMST